ncbi:hypothetical protein CENSYa_0676 [Cenarchaeum symbiosum A]|uniref:Uncharacterized protein n=1 Tax=Cenarchaeum symbiosum (strain A) TaxID=414004 RepID=A0RVE2_CENSY|nr:hypothetical protein CENSYa_0676 [Cenarchaeum symbiosum A]
MTGKSAGLSAIFGMIIGLGITGAAAGGLYYTFTSQVDPFTSASSIDVRNLNAIRDGDELIITATIKNTGTTSISEVLIEDIRVSDLAISQDGDRRIMVSDGAGTRFFCTGLASGTCGAGTVTGNSTELTDADHDGISILNADEDEANRSVLEGGRSNAFKISIDSDMAPAIGESVRISDRLTLTLRFASGDDTLVSDAFSTRVKPG